MAEAILHGQSVIRTDRMKKTTGRLLKGIIFAAILIGMMAGTSYALRPFGVDGPMNAVDAFHSLDRDTAEVIIYGSSRAWRGLDPLPMYEEYGIAAYNYGCNWQKINTSALYVSDSLRTQSPKVAVVEVKNVGKLLWDKDLNGEIYYSKRAALSKDKLYYLWQCFREKTERYISYVLPVLACHENWQEVLKGAEHEGHSREEILSTLGFIPSQYTYETTIEDYLTFEQRELNPSSIAVLDDIVEACHARGTEVVFYIAPSKTKFAYRVAMQRYCESRRCHWLDGYEKQDEIGIDEKTDFSDKYHLNTSGAGKMASYLGSYLKKRFRLTDIRGEAGTVWDKAASSAAGAKAGT